MLKILKYFLLSFFTLILIVVAGTAYAVYYTSAPLKVVQFFFEEPSQIAEVDGSLSEGLRFENLEYYGLNGEVVKIGLFEFSYNGLWDLYKNNRLIINKFSLSDCHAILPESESASTLDDDEDRSDKNEGEQLSYSDTTEDLTFEIGELLVRDCSLETFGDSKPNPPIVLDLLKLNHFKTNEGEVSFDLFELKSNLSDLKVAGYDSQKDDSLPIQGTIKATFSEELVGDISFDIHYGMEEGLHKLDLNFFDGKVIAKKHQKGRFDIKITDFSPSDYFAAKDSKSISKLNLRASLQDLNELKLDNMKIHGGEFLFYNEPVKILPAPIFRAPPGADPKKEVDGWFQIKGKTVVGRNIDIIYDTKNGNFQILETGS